MPHPRAGLLGIPLLAFGLASCTDAPVAPTAAPDQAALSQSARAGTPIPDQYIVMFKDGVSDVPGLARQLAAAHGGRIGHTYQHAIRGFSANMSATAAEALRRNPNVALVEQDQVVTLAAVQNNPTWGLDRIDQRDLPLSATYTYNTTGQGVTAYVLDTGIETSHPEFGGRASIGFDTFGGNGQDCHRHGTHVAGTVGSTTYGVAKGVTLIGVRVLDCGGGGTLGGIIAGVDWVTGHHQAGQPAVANMSLGGSAASTLDAAVNNSIADGVTYVLAAGNENQNACNVSPARTANALTVGSTNSGDVRASTSNYGSCLDLFAPGVDILSTGLGGSTFTESGTSMAAPHVAGAVARYLQANPSASPATVNAAIIGAATTGKVTSAGTGSPNRLLFVDPGSTGTPTPGSEDTFDTNSLGSYTIYNTPGAWSISDGFLNADASAVQSVVIRNGTSLGSAFVETETDAASDGGLVLRFQSSGSYYLMAIRDDSRFGYANVEIYRASAGSFTRIAGPVDLTFTRGVNKIIKFEAIGSTLRAYVDGAVVLQATDATYASGGIGLRHDNTRGEAGITSRFDVLRWGNAVSVDNFDVNTLGAYTLYNTTSAWSISGGFLNASTAARQAVAIRTGSSVGNGYLETTTDQASDGGLVLRFQSNGNYYLMALRDDSRFGYANIEIYRASGGSFTRIAGPVDLTFVRGTSHTFRFEGVGSTLTAYMDGTAVLSATDAAYSTGAIGLRHDNTRAESGITSRFDALRWTSY